MNRDKTFVIARAVRNWDDSIAEVTLVWRYFDSKLSVEYRQVNKGHSHFSITPDWCVKSWLKIFIRDQDNLESDSYYITLPPSIICREFILDILESV